MPITTLAEQLVLIQHYTNSATRAIARGDHENATAFFNSIANAANDAAMLSQNIYALAFSADPPTETTP
jgi:hypothetical protein